ncbi:neutral zinc metallopeptidase [Kribbella sp. NPDC055071]
MPEENADGAAAGGSNGNAGTPETSPTPGHFLPGNSGDVLTDAARTGLNRPQPLELGKARDVSAIDQGLKRKARPLPNDPDAISEYSGPPAAPLTSAPPAPLTGTRRTGGPRPKTGWHSNPSRTGAQFTAEAPPVKPPRHYSKGIIAALSALILIILAGATYAGFKLIGSYDNPVDNPLARPSLKNTEPPPPIPPDPTVTQIVPGIPDIVRLQQNKIYTAGVVASVSCKEPAVVPNSQSQILNYYKALLPCLDKAWAPLVKKAGYTFRSPKVLLQSSVASINPDCTGEVDVAFYCSTGEAIYISWKEDLKFYKSDPTAAKVWMLDTFAHEYGHHVQQMTEMITASFSRQGWTNSKSMKLEWARRRELQATCFSAAFLGANKQSLGMSGEKLRVWEYETQHSGDEYNPKKIKDHGSRKSQWLWAGPAFKSANPASCNTFAAPAAKVS